ncbi:Eco57I restriction-modification methylase domain-containing protein [Litorimonas haliclonae]|uniref:Eco57I restriction-modification methylase domain-containing protein n=1 Tax=Litorimonas haliclonae TaxID=2081977 RepID=UPI0039EE36A2
MPLFNARFLKKTIGETPPPIPAEHRTILESWSADVKTNRIKEVTESQIESRFYEEIVKSVLGYSGEGAAETFQSEPKVNIGTGIVDLALGDFDKSGRKDVKVPFELKGARTSDLDAIMSGRNITPVQQAWQYAVANSGTKWILVCNMTELRLYSYDRGINEYERWELYRLTDPYEYARFKLLLSPENLLTDVTRGLLRKSRDVDQEISEQLYADYKDLRLGLIGEIRRTRKDIPAETAIKTAQTILDRILFIAFAEDTGLLPENTIKKAYEFRNDYGDPVPAWQQFKGLFRAVDKGNEALKIPRYNGGLFEENDLISSLELSDTLMAGFKALADYDFASEVRVTVLGRIFEQSITDLEELQSIAQNDIDFDAPKSLGTTGRRKREGVIYTPDYIAEFIVDQTIGTRLKELFSMCVAKYAKKGEVEDYENIIWKKGKSVNGSTDIDAWRAYRELISELKVVDPACGSGVFLVTAFDYLKTEYNRVNNKIAELDPKGAMDLFDTDREVLTKNLYGVDVNAESVEITKLSLWLKTAKYGKVLDSLDGNIKVGDSLIGTSNFAYHEHSFDWRTAFPQVEDGLFDIVLGNPPYVRQERFKDIKEALKKRYEVYHGVADLFVYFFERGMRQLKEGGRLGYICSSTFFKTNSGGPLRNYIAANGLIETMVDFGDLQVFEGVTTYPAILTVRKGTPAPGRHTKFWVLDDLPRDNFAAAYEDKAQEFDQSDLSSAAWKFEAPELIALRRKLTEGRKTLKEVYGSPYRGILTGRNEAFVIDRATRDRLVKEDGRTVERLKPWLVGRDLKKWRVEPQDQYLIFFPKGWTEETYGELTETKAWQKLETDFPAICEHLLPYAQVCRKRTDQGDYWWELRACDYYDKFEEPKIIYPDLSQGPKFSSNIKCYSPNTTYFIPQNDEALVGLLNANITWFFLRGISDAMRGGTWRMFSQNIERIPIPFITSSIRKEVNSLSKVCQQSWEKTFLIMRRVQNRIPDLCPDDRDPKLSNKLKDWHRLPDFAAFRKEIKRVYKTDIPLSERSEWEAWLETERTAIGALQGQIASAEAEINRIVYELFDLTPEEIALIEANV